MNKKIVVVGIIAACGVLLLNAVYPIMTLPCIALIEAWTVVLTISFAIRKSSVLVNKNIVYSLPLSVITFIILFKTNGFNFEIPLSFLDGLVLVAFLSVLFALINHIRLLLHSNQQLPSYNLKAVSILIGSLVLLSIVLFTPSTSTRRADELVYTYEIEGKTINFYDSINGDYYTDGMNRYGVNKSRNYLNLNENEYMYVDFFSEYDFFDDGNKINPIERFENSSIYRLEKEVLYDIYIKEALGNKDIYQVILRTPSMDTGKEVEIDWEQVKDIISTLSEVEAGKTSFKGTTLLEFKYGKALFDKEQIVVKNTIQVYFNEEFLYVIALDNDVKYQMTSQAYEKLNELCV